MALSLAQSPEILTFITCMKIGYRVEQLYCTEAEALQVFNTRIANSGEIGLVSIAYYGPQGLVFAYPAS